MNERYENKYHGNNYRRNFKERPFQMNNGRGKTQFRIKYMSRGKAYYVNQRDQ
jgi:hypothetical protein